MLIVDSTGYAQSQLKVFSGTQVLFLTPIYCFARAIQRKSIWKTLFWLIPAIGGFLGSRNGWSITRHTIASIHLKECGSQIVMKSVLGVKHVIEISELSKPKAYREFMQ